MPPAAASGGSMFFIPLSQSESVELVIHALRIAGGQESCSTCPARKVCTKQCLAIADGVARMVAAGTLPSLGEEPPPQPDGTSSGRSKRSHLEVVK